MFYGSLFSFGTSCESPPAEAADSRLPCLVHAIERDASALSSQLSRLLGFMLGPLVLTTYMSDELLIARLTVPVSPQSNHASFLLSAPAECHLQTRHSPGSVSHRPGKWAALSTRCGCLAHGHGCLPRSLSSRLLTRPRARTSLPPTSSGPL